jgi:hypothetical protein
MVSGVSVELDIISRFSEVRAIVISTRLRALPQRLSRTLVIFLVGLRLGIYHQRLEDA